MSCCFLIPPMMLVKLKVWNYKKVEQCYFYILSILVILVSRLWSRTRLFSEFHLRLVVSRSCSSAWVSVCLAALWIRPWPTALTCCSFGWMLSTCSLSTACRGKERQWGWLTECQTNLQHIINEWNKERRPGYNYVRFNCWFNWFKSTVQEYSSQQSEIHCTLNLRDNKWKWTVPHYEPTYRNEWILGDERQTQGCAEIREKQET